MAAKKVVVGMSRRCSSSVAAYLFRGEQGYDVIGRPCRSVRDEDNFVQEKWRMLWPFGNG